ncbi:aspartate aminotransferase family protein [Botrimarina hoheduenensis]|nr:aminotransferase class III-fold pyridoxal phosphate-dependent enzyme [Botrimarina hoheduenensis]
MSAESPLASVWARVIPDTIVRGEGCWLWSDSGRKYLDFTSGIGVTNTGHCHPRVVEAIRHQAGELLFGQMNCVVPETALRLAEALTPHLPKGLDRFFFSNSGAEAVEGAVKLARFATGKPNIIALQGGFHGRTAMTMALTSSKTVYRAGYQPLPAGVFFAPFPYPLHYLDSGLCFGTNDGSCQTAGHCGGPCDEERLATFCISQLKQVLASQSAPNETAAVLLEPVLGEGGYVPAPHTFVRQLREVCDEHGLLLIVDEIQSGFGRTGEWWRHTGAGVTPDILVAAKGIASGLPMSAIISTKEIMDRWPPGAHGGTYGGGSAIAQAAAIATIEVLQEEGLVENARQRGRQLTAALKEIAQQNPELREVRGPGLMIGCEFQAGETGKKQASTIAKRCAEAGLLLLTCGTAGNVLRWIPPLIVTAEEIDHGLSIFHQALDEALA